MKRPVLTPAGIGLQQLHNVQVFGGRQYAIHQLHCSSLRCLAEQTGHLHSAVEIEVGGWVRAVTENAEGVRPLAPVVGSRGGDLQAAAQIP